MDAILSQRQGRILVICSILVLLFLDARAVRMFIEFKQYLETQRAAQLGSLEKTLQRELDATPDLFLGREASGGSDAAAVAILMALRTRYKLLSAEILDQYGFPLASSSRGPGRKVQDTLLGLTPGKQVELFLKRRPLYVRPGTGAPGSPPTIGIYLPGRASDGVPFALKVIFEDQSLLQVTEISRDILRYQAIGIGALILLLFMTGYWIVKPHRLTLRHPEGIASSSTKPVEPPLYEGAMMVASFQGVIAQLREKEKRLTEVSRADRERAATAARVSTDILQLMETAVLLFSSQGRVVQGNRAASDLFGMPPLVLYNQHYTELFAGEREWVATMRASLQRGQREQDRMITRATAQGERSYRVSATPVLEPDGRYGAVCVISDVTDRIGLERLLADKEKLAALGEMAGGLAHEVRNSLGTLVGLMRLLASEPAPDTGGADTSGDGRAQSDSVKRYQQMMQREIHELNRIVGDFLDFTRPLAPRLDPVDCREVLTRCMDEIALQFPERARDVTIEGEFVPVPGDEALLRQAFFNLIKNGIESGQSVTVGISGEVLRPAHMLRLRFLDTGCGIDPADIEKVFIPFYTTKENGYGIGLALVKKIVLAHAGRIEVASTPGSGAEFHVYLPLGD